jgi:parallel beta-helix repeat protein
LVRAAADTGIKCEYDPTEQARNVKIVNNIVEDCGAAGIQYYGANKPEADALISGNSCFSNGEEGIGVVDDAANITVRDNTCRGNGGAGLRIYRGQPSLRITGNRFYGNTGGSLVIESPESGVVADTHDFLGTAAPSAGFTPWLACFPLGIHARGRVYVWAKQGGQHSEEMYDVSFDGTTLTPTALHTRSSSSLNPEIRVSGSNLEVRAASSDAQDVRLAVRFDGYAIHR